VTITTSQEESWLLRWPGRSMWIAVTVAGSAVAVYLISRGSWMILLVLLAAVPGFLVIQRYPLAVMAIWFAVVPFLSRAEDGSGLLQVYWLVHRLLPLATLAVLLLARVTGTGYRRLGRLGWPEVLMLTYLVASGLSILYNSDNVIESFRFLYDRVAVPMILYVLVRLIRPGPAAMKSLSYILLFIILTQATIGIASWVAPGLIPERLLGRAGTRTTGTLINPNVFGIVVLAAGALFLHISRYVDDWRTKVGVPVFVFSVVAAVVTFSRAVWLAAVAVVVGIAIVYPRLLGRLLLVAALVTGLFVASGNQWVGDYLGERLHSQESALSRLPVVYASVRMIQEKPLTGWGYGDFDKYDYQFQSRVGEWFVPSKNHSSHNVFLTIGAEQGLIGLGAYLFPAIYWLARTPRAWARLGSEDMFGKRLLLILWVVIAGHVIVSNFSNIRMTFGLAVWWLSLALIGNIITGKKSSSAT
jgi:O-antigen ligase